MVTILGIVIFTCGTIFVACVLSLVGDVIDEEIMHRQRREDAKVRIERLRRGGQYFVRRD